MTTPLVRHPSLQPLSREHHQILLLSFKIRQGLKQNASPQVMREYCVWFFDSFLQPHIKKEQTHFSYIFKKNSQLLSELENSHKELSESFQKLEPKVSDLKKLEKHLVDTIRFEERVLFEQLQADLSPKAIEYLEAHLQEKTFSEHPKLIFWM